MNFLEQLAAEWYEHQGYFTRTNLRFGANANGRGGHVGEMDVIAYKPEDDMFIHLEASTDASSWPERKERFERKFTDARRYYMEIFPFKHLGTFPRQIALVGFNRRPFQNPDPWISSAPHGSPWGDLPIEIRHIPDFLHEITEELKTRDPEGRAVSETLPLLRAIQYSSFFSD